MSAVMWNLSIILTMAPDESNSSLAVCTCASNTAIWLRSFFSLPSLGSTSIMPSWCRTADIGRWRQI